MALASTLLGAAGGLYNMWKGNKRMTGIADSGPSAEALREESFGRRQGLIDRMTNFGQYSAPAMDLATQAGNKGVEDAMMMGMGGSQANAIKNRMRRQNLSGVYDNFQQGMGTALGAQMGIDQGIFGQMGQQRQARNNIKMMQANNQMNLGAGMMPEGGARGLLDIIGQNPTVKGWLGQ